MKRIFLTGVKITSEVLKDNNDNYFVLGETQCKTLEKNKKTKKELQIYIHLNKDFLNYFEKMKLKVGSYISLEGDYYFQYIKERKTLYLNIFPKEFNYASSDICTPLVTITDCYISKNLSYNNFDLLFAPAFIKTRKKKESLYKKSEPKVNLIFKKSSFAEDKNIQLGTRLFVFGILSWHLIVTNDHVYYNETINVDFCEKLIQFKKPLSFEEKLIQNNNKTVDNLNIDDSNVPIL